MRRFLFVAICLAPTLAAADDPIIGGTATKVGDFPSTVAIEVGQGLCSGELIQPDWVMTAAHCVDPAVVGEPDQAGVTASVRVHIGTVDINTQQGMVFTAKETFGDPGFNINDLGHNDLGLIHLSMAVSGVTPALINLHAADAPVGTVVTLVGFGTTELGAQGPAGTQFALAGRTTEDCAMAPSDLGPPPSNANMLCFSQSDSKGTCEGDSGGPAFAMIGGKTKIVGVTSFGDNNCGEFGADTRIDAEKAFVLQHIPDVECNTDDDCASTQSRTCFDHQCILQPFGSGAIGATCAGGSDCDDGSCGTGPAATGSGTQMLCTLTCTPGAADACPSGFDCLAAGSSGACWPDPNGGGSGGGCCDSSGQGGGTAVMGVLIVGGVIRRRRRA